MKLLTVKENIVCSREESRNVVKGNGQLYEIEMDEHHKEGDQVLKY